MTQQMKTAYDSKKAKFRRKKRSFKFDSHVWKDKIREMVLNILKITSITETRNSWHIQFRMV